MRRILTWLLLLLIATPTLAQPAGDSPLTIALLPLGSGKARLDILTALLEQHLLANPQLRLLERAQIDLVLEEQHLNLAMGPDQGPQRLALGELLRADLLILLRAEEDTKIPLQLVISESRQGLRITHEAFPLADDPNLQSQSIATLVDTAVQRMRHPFRALVALPPLASLDLTWEHAREGHLYAHVLQNALSHLPGVWFIELDEVRSITEERLRSSGEHAVARQLPVAILGEYRHSEEKHVTLTLAAEQGGHRLGTITSPALAPQDVAAWLGETAAPHLANQLTGQTIRMNPQSDAKQLAVRAGLYVRLGMPAEALTLTEACLLVDPDQLDQHIRALRLISTLTPSMFGEPTTPEAFEDGLIQTVAFWQSAQHHLDQIIHRGLVPSNDRRADGESMWWDLIVRYVFATDIVDRTWQRAPHLRHDRTIPIASALAPVFAGRVAIRERLLNLLEDRQTTDQSVALLDATAVLVNRPFSHWGEPIADERKTHLRLLRAIAGRADVLRYTDPAILSDSSRVQWTERDLPYLEEVIRLPSTPLQERARALHDRITTHALPSGDDTMFTRINDSMQLSDPPLKKLLLEATDDRGNTYPVFPTDWLACGEKYDLVWERHRRNALYLMREPGRLEHLATFDLDTPWLPNTGHTHVNRIGSGHGLHHPCYDGQYVWAPVVGPEPLLLVIDPETQQTWRLGGSAGLPPMNRGAAAIGLEPGTICLTGSFVGDADQPIRAWCAVVRFSPEKPDQPQIEIFHEAIEQFQREAPADIRWTGPALGFRAGPMLHYTDPRGKPWVVAWRKFETAYLSYNPLWIDLEQRQVVTQARGPWSLSRHAVPHGDRLVFLTIDGSLNRGPSRLMSLGIPQTHPQEHARDLPRLYQPILWHDVLLGVDEEGKTYRIAPQDGQVDLFDPRLPRTNQQTRILASAHLGLVMLIPVDPDPFLCEAYIVTHGRSAALPASARTTTRLVQPTSLNRNALTRQNNNLEVLSLLGRPYHTSSSWWSYGGLREREGQPAYRFAIQYNRQNQSRIEKIHDR